MSTNIVPMLAKCGCGFSGLGDYSFSKSKFEVKILFIYPCGKPQCKTLTLMRETAKKNGWEVMEGKSNEGQG